MDLIYFVLTFPILGIVATLVLLNYMQTKDHHITRNFEFHESVVTGAIEEPRAIRELTEVERNWLINKHRLRYKQINNPLLWVGYYLIIRYILGQIVGSFSIPIITFQIMLNPGNEVRSYLPIILNTVSFIILIVLFKFIRQTEGNYYKDSRVAVWQVQGAILDIHTSKDKYNDPIQISFTVRNNQFIVPYQDKLISKTDTAKRTVDQLLKDNLRNIYHLVSPLPENTEVIVQYSPFSKKVWDVRTTP